MRRQLIGVSAGSLSSVALAAAILPLRAHLSIATCALVLVIPVVAGVAIGGFSAGLVCVGVGFVVFDIAFIPPYWTLTIGSGQDWAALGVYVLVTAIVARVVAHLEQARAAANLRATNARRLADISELLLGEDSVDDLARVIVEAVRAAFALDGVSLLLTRDDRLEVVASTDPSSPGIDLTRVYPDARGPVALTIGGSSDASQTLALATSGRPVGLLELRGLHDDGSTREVLRTLANHLALALERAQLHEQAQRVELLEEVDRLRRSLLGAVSHDLRTPLATIKVASSTLRASGSALTREDANELSELIDLQADRLTRLVMNLLDMTRIEAGVLEVRRVPISLESLVAEAIAALRPLLDDRVVRVELSPDDVTVDCDAVLIGQVLADLLDNADRFAPAGTPIVVGSRTISDARVEVSVSDAGPGVAASEREAVFERFVRFDTGGRSGLGLAIARAFVEAHGETISVREAERGGACFFFTLSLAHFEFEDV